MFSEFFSENTNVLMGKKLWKSVYIFREITFVYAFGFGWVDF